MRAMVIASHGGREAIRLRNDFPEPEIKPDEAIIQIAATSVNFHDILTRRGMPGIRISLPIIVGSDIAGVVESVGGEPGNAWIGKRVLVDPLIRNDSRIDMVGETRNGGRAERAAVPISSLIEIPDSVSLDVAATLPLAYGTAHRMMINRGGLRSGERVLILGASGGVGVACVQIAKMMGAEVVACASSDEKLGKLSEIGVDHVVNYSSVSFREAVADIYGKPKVNGSGGVDVAVNFTGGRTFPDTQKCVTVGGRILCCGATAGFDLSMDARYWWSFEHLMIGSDGWRRADLKTLVGLVAELRLAPIIDSVLPMEQCAEAERLLEDREVFGKVVLKP